MPSEPGAAWTRGATEGLAVLDRPPLGARHRPWRDPVGRDSARRRGDRRCWGCTGGGGLTRHLESDHDSPGIADELTPASAKTSHADRLLAVQRQLDISLLNSYLKTVAGLSIRCCPLILGLRVAHSWLAPLRRPRSLRHSCDQGMAKFLLMCDVICFP